jgi:transcription initiation factor IIE alpha subunit
MLYLWQCPHCFDSGVHNINPARCPTCGYKWVEYDIRPSNGDEEKEMKKMEYEREFEKKRSK